MSAFLIVQNNLPLYVTYLQNTSTLVFKLLVLKKVLYSPNYINKIIQVQISTFPIMLHNQHLIEAAVFVQTAPCRMKWTKLLELPDNMTGP